MIAEKTHLTAAEYLAFERQSEERHEYHGGELRLMAGASRKHNLLSLNIASFLNEKLRGKPCKPFMNDMRVWIASAERYFYPDIAVICGKEPFIEDDVAADATVIVEVLSDSTEAFDRGKKFECYQYLPSLQDYILVSQNEMRIEHFHKITSNEWRYVVLSKPEDALSLESIGVQISLQDVYADAEI
ncbi:MAG: Uma2 family endonuclease [Chloroherpetonaceae bacterium]